MSAEISGVPTPASRLDPDAGSPTLGDSSPLLDLVRKDRGGQAERQGDEAIDWSDRGLLEQALGEPMPSRFASVEEAQRWCQRAKDALGIVVAEIDRLLTDQVNAVIHHPRFQSLEASWRGLWSLVDQAQSWHRAPIRIQALSLRREEWVQDITTAEAFDRSALFWKIYEEEFGMAGGLPFGLIVADFAIGPSPKDLVALEGLAGIAAAALCPTLLPAAPSLLDLERWADLPNLQDLEAASRSPEFVRWRSFRDSPDSRYVGLVMPRVLMRLPYDGRETRGFCYREDVQGKDLDHYLWGNPAYAFARVVLRSFANYRWLADIRGVERDVEGGGLLTDLPRDAFSTDSPGVVSKPAAEVILTEDHEARLARLGLIPLSHCHDTPYAAFHSNQSLQKPKEYSDPAATSNARLATMLQYTLCVSRFAHYVKVMGRDWVGSGVEAKDLQRRLNRWLKQYVADGDDFQPEVKAEKPLRKAEVLIEPHPTQPGTYQCKLELWPHYQIDQMTTSVRVSTSFVRR